MAETQSSEESSMNLSVSGSISDVDSTVTSASEEESEPGFDSVVEPYMYEPVLSDSGGDSPDEVDSAQDDERLLNTNWCVVPYMATYRRVKVSFIYCIRCTCGHCTVMDTVEECICCNEVEKVVEKMQEFDTKIQCITDHVGFKEVCLNQWVLQAAYFAYRQHYGNDNQPIHE